MQKTVNILGTEYTIEKKEYKDEPVFEKRDIDGYCDGQLKRIVQCDMRTHPLMVDESEEYCKSCERHTLKHEIVHAFSTNQVLWKVPHNSAMDGRRMKKWLIGL